MCWVLLPEVPCRADRQDTKQLLLWLKGIVEILWRVIEKGNRNSDKLHICKFIGLFLLNSAKENDFVNGLVLTYCFLR